MTGNVGNAYTGIVFTDAALKRSPSHWCSGFSHFDRCDCDIDLCFTSIGSSPVCVTCDTLSIVSVMLFCIPISPGRNSEAMEVEWSFSPALSNVAGPYLGYQCEGFVFTIKGKRFNIINLKSA